MARALVLALPAAALAAALGLLLRSRRAGPRRSSLDALPPIVLRNADGLEVHITPVGAAIQRLIVPAPDGRRLDVVLGFEHASTYALLDSPPYFGAVVGRVANRIAGGRFSLGGKAYQLATNNGPNALHGGPGGFHTRVFSVASHEERPDGSSAVELRYTSPDGEEGYPGTLEVSVRYELPARAPELRITLSATTDAPTPVNLAQHSYFNLGGHDSGDVLGHVVKLAADHYTPVHPDTQIPTGEILPVAGSPFDFVQPHAVGERIEQVPGGNGYDHNLVLFGMGPQARFITRGQAVSSVPRLAATVTEPQTGLTLEVLTTAPGMQFYTGGFLGRRWPDAKGGAAYPRFAGLCLEAQSFPDALNQRAFPSVVLQPGETYKQGLVYRFSSSSSDGGS